MSAAPPRRRHGEGGFTLVEVAIATLVFLLVLLVTNGLLIESLRLFSLAGRELREPQELAALRLLREDLHAAETPVPSLPTDPLLARQADGFALWQLVGHRLERHLLALDGTDRGRRPMLDGMIAFRWQVTAPGLTEVTLVRRRPLGASGWRAASAAWRPLGETLEQATVVVSTRLGPEP